MRKAIFIDRDGTINSDVGHYYIYKPEDFKLNPGVGEGLKLLQDVGFLIIVITNQGGVAKGEYTISDVEKVHLEMRNQLKKFGVSLTEIYYCPHHSDIQRCLCRKPGNLNIEKAISRFRIDRTQSYMIGDSERDMQAGQKSKLRCIKISTNADLLPVCQEILDEHRA
ncbi:D-glycero-alpha-D-manno-heptose-1,7-bisphosphate 7-phosphatase [Saccharicrinis sp. FJH62]|uniref:D-glycero-alpha-D-manno-heptose-1,7-bisphosphate 7-phosphatase n=1 Tax=Saccharicrinis sp. FJH62 TaxID=3344657 RepID=UPI0035D4C56D